MGAAEDQQDAVANHVSGQANKPLSKPPHALNIEQVVEELKANVEDGLTASEAQSRLQEYGKNQFGAEKGVQPIKILIAQVANAMTLVSYTPQKRIAEQKCPHSAG